jgi:hypothetical protein
MIRRQFCIAAVLLLFCSGVFDPEVSKSIFEQNFSAQYSRVLSYLVFSAVKLHELFPSMLASCLAAARQVCQAAHHPYFLN